MKGDAVAALKTSSGHAEIERTVEWVDTDASGHHHNSAIMRWVEAAEAELFRKLALQDYFAVAPRVHEMVNYKARLWFGQRVTASVKFESLGQNSVTYAFVVHGHSHSRIEAEIAAYGTVTLAHLPLGAQRSEPWPEGFKSAVLPLLEDPR